MNTCQHRDLLSREEKLRRSYYEVLRDELDQFALEHALVGSYFNFSRLRVPYPYVELRELKPRARIPTVEYEAQNQFLIIFAEDHIEKKHKKYIRYFDDNKTTKQNLLSHKTFPDVEGFNRNMKLFESRDFFGLLKSLLPVDYALLIQKNNAGSGYALTHFHVRIDWPITDAAEDLARHLRYISKDLYEKGDGYAEDFQKKFFEYYGVPVLSGGRRTAAIVAARYFSSFPGIATVYVSSSESRTLFRIDERGVSKSVLIKLQAEDMKKLAEVSGLTMTSLSKNYVIDRQRKNYICVFSVRYDRTAHALPSEGGRLRDLKQDTNWLTVTEELILPRPSVINHAPIPFKLVYS